MSAEPFVAIEEAARFLGVKVSWLYEQVRHPASKVPSYKVGAFRRFKLSELDSWARGTLRTEQGVGGKSA